MKRTLFFLVALVGALVGGAQAQTTYVLMSEDFEGLTLGPNVDEGVAGDTVWTDVPPAGWFNDASGVPGIEDPATDGVTEWAGWGFANKDWWVTTAADQRRSEFKLGTGTVAIADPDEWDDAGHPKDYPANTYDVWLSTAPIDLSSAVPGTVQLKFDSSWRPEYDDDYHQTASITVSFDGGEKIEVMRWESNSASPNFHDDDSTNETIYIDIPNPAGAGSMVLTFGLFDAGNDWWWAIDNIVVTGGWSGVRASNPSPDNGAQEVSVRTTLSWTPGEFVGGLSPKHRVLLSNDLAAVSDATAVISTQDANSYDATGQLDYGTTYYWRVDEANNTTGWDEGSVWSFTTEAYSYPITNLTAEASIEQPTSPAIRTIDGSGLNEFDEHDVQLKDMWVTPGGLPVWIQYAFDREYMLDKMLVWNANSELEPFMGFGAKTVVVEYSTDGQNWTVLENVPEFAQGTGQATYTANNIIDFGGVTAKYVKLTVNTTYGATGMASLSEVRFFYIPVQAGEPKPADEATGVSVDATLTWRAGREAVSHKVYFSADEQAVADGTALVDTTDEVGYTPDGLVFGDVYYWKVNEVNEAAATTEWAGDVWSFTAQQFGPIDDFESYTDNLDAEETVWHAWIDGYGDQSSGSQVGYTDSPFCEKNTVHGGKQAMPFQYNNANSPYYSEAVRTWTAAQDWTANGADTFKMFFYGAAANVAGPLYISVEDSAGKKLLVTNSDANAVLATSWQEWTIPFSTFTDAGVNVTKVKKMYIGVGSRTSPTAGGAGLVFIDDISRGTSGQ
ncbi:MAG: discoidin domain-containing protein [Phycisphaerales bacterium]